MLAILVMMGLYSRLHAITSHYKFHRQSILEDPEKSDPYIFFALNVSEIN